MWVGLSVVFANVLPLSWEVIACTRRKPQARTPRHQRRGGGNHPLGHFCPLDWEMIQFDKHIFQNGLVQPPTTPRSFPIEIPNSFSPFFLQTCSSLARCCWLRRQSPSDREFYLGNLGPWGGWKLGSLSQRPTPPTPAPVPTDAAVPILCVIWMGFDGLDGKLIDAIIGKQQGSEGKKETWQRLANWTPKVYICRTSALLFVHFFWVAS